jgi:hypothetical protein
MNGNNGLQTLSQYIDGLYNQALCNYHEKLEMHYIHAVSSLSLDKKFLEHGVYVFTNKLNEPLVESFLKKKGYVLNVVLGKTIWTKGFVCVEIHENSIEVWIDIKNAKSVFVNESYLTGLPLTLNYMEKYT